MKERGVNGSIENVTESLLLLLLLLWLEVSIARCTCSCGCGKGGERAAGKTQLRSPADCSASV
jgi:hypothetical protein